jgi:hypothetical protein
MTNITGLKKLKSNRKLTTTSRNYTFHSEFDTEKLRARYGTDLGFCINMFEVCLYTAPIEIAHMHTAIQEKDYLAIVTIGNKLKSTFEIVGHEELVSMLECIVLYAKDKNLCVFGLCSIFLEKVQSKLEVIRNEIFDISQFLKNEHSVITPISES